MLMGDKDSATCLFLPDFRFRGLVTGALGLIPSGGLDLFDVILPKGDVPACCVKL